MSPFRIVLLFTGISILGLFFVPYLPVTLVPHRQGNSLTVHFSLTNSTPELTEALVTSLLENAFSTLAGVKKIESSSGYTSGSITLLLDKAADPDFMRLEVSTKLRALYHTFPPGTSYPVIEPMQHEEEAKEEPLLVFSFNAPLEGNQIKAVVERHISRELSGVEGIKELRLSGAEAPQLSVLWNPQQATARGYDLQGLRQAMAGQTTDIRLGTEVVNGHLLATKVSRQPKTAQELNNLPLPAKKGHEPVFLHSMATAVEENEEQRSLYRINGLSSVNLSLYPHPGENLIALAGKSLSRMEQLKAALPAGFEVRKEFDSTEYLSAELHKITKRAVLAVALLTIFIFLIRRDFKYLTVLLTGTLITLLLTLFVIYLIGLEVHLYSIAGLTMSLGLILDNSLVMTDHLRKKGDRRVFLALLGASLTTVASLSVVFFLPEEEKNTLIDFSLSVCIALSNSLLVALFYIPAAHSMLTGRFKPARGFLIKLRRQVRVLRVYEHLLAVLSRHKAWFVGTLVLCFGLPVFLLPREWAGHQGYNRLVGSEMYQEKIRPWTDKLLGGTLRMFVHNVFEHSSYRSPERTKLYLSATLPYGHTLEQMDQIIRRMEQYLQKVGGIDKFVTHIPSGENAYIVINFLQEYEQSGLPYQLKGRLISEALDLGGVTWSVFGVGQGFSNKGGENLPSFRVLLKGYNYEELERQAGAMAAKLLRHQRIKEVETNARFTFFEKDAQEYVFEVMPEKAATYHIPVTKMISSVAELSPPLSPSFHLPVGNEVMPVYFHAKDAASLSAFDFRERIFYAGGEPFQMKNIGNLTFRQVRNTIRKEDKQYLRVVAFDYFGSHHFGGKYLDEVLDQMKKEFPPGYSADKMDSGWLWSNVKREYSLLLVVLLAIFWICGVLFENFRQAFLIILTIPVSFIGVMGAFAWFNLYFDQGGYAAFILTSGLVVNSSIFIINDFNNDTKHRLRRRVVRSVTGKFFSISMTILSTCLGLIPFLIDGQQEIFWFSLGAGTIGGLLLSFVAVFLLLPVLMYGSGSRKRSH